MDRSKVSVLAATVTSPTSPLHEHDVDTDQQPEPEPDQQLLKLPQVDTRDKIIHCKPKFRSKGHQMGESFIVWPLPPYPLIPRHAHDDEPKRPPPPLVPPPAPQFVPPPAPPLVPTPAAPLAPPHTPQYVPPGMTPSTSTARPAACSTKEKTLTEAENVHDEEIFSESEEEDGSSDDSDSNWEPSDEEDSDTDEEEVEVEEPYKKNSNNKEKFVVYLDNLMDLFVRCKCGRDCHVKLIKPRSYGSLLKVVATCSSCGYLREWQSQPRIGTIPAGNLLISKGILFGGESPTKFLRTLTNSNIEGISQRTYHRLQSTYLIPAAVSVWRRCQMALIEELKAKGEPLVLGGDGRADSPGHCAKYGSYTMMDLTSGKVIDIQLVQSNEVANSNAMEPEGLKRSLNFLLDQGLKIKTLITDRHMTIQKIMRKEYKGIDHRYDVWHIAKGVKKKLIAKSKLKECEDLALWRKSIINHLYWAASSTPDGNGDLMAAKFRSIKNHVVNKHDGHDEHKDFTKCAHEEDITPRQWMDEGSKAYDVLCDVIMKTHLKTALKKMSPNEQTSKVEAFHYVLCLFAPKLLAFSFGGMVARCYIAALHWNENGNRPQATRKADGALQYNISYPKAKQGEAAVKKVLKPCTYGYVETLSEETDRMTKMKKDDLKDLKDAMPEL